MKILFLSQRFLFPMDTGGKIRTGNILRHLSKKHSVTLVSNVETPKDKPFLTQVDTLCDNFIAVPWKEVKRYSPLFFIRLFVQLFSIYPVNVLNDTSRALRRAVEREKIEGGYDLAICDFVQSALMFRRIETIPTILFQHNVESIIIRRHLTRSTNFIVRLFWWLQWKKMLWFEGLACRRFNHVIAVSEKDRSDFENLYGIRKISAITTGVDIEYFTPRPEIDETPHSIIFCGSMDWLPNEDAMLFFINDIYPLIKETVPDASLTIVGRNPSPLLRQRANSRPDIVLTGWVEDTRPYIAAGSISIVPIRIGGGTRMKIYEAMAMGKPVISTAIGAEGLPVSNGETIIIEDDPRNMAETIIALFNNPRRRKGIGENALEFVRKHFSWTHVTADFEKACIATVNNMEA